MYTVTQIAESHKFVILSDIIARVKEVACSSQVSTYGPGLIEVHNFNLRNLV